MAGFLTSILGPIGGPVLVFNAAKAAAAAGAGLTAAGATAGSTFWTVAGVVLWFLGVHALSQHYRDEGLVDKALFAGALLAGSTVIPLQAVVANAIGALAAGADPDATLEGMVRAGLLPWILLLGAAYFYKQLLEGLAQLSGGQPLLERAAGLALPGAALAIVGVGGLVLVAAAALSVAGTLSLTPPQVQSHASQPRASPAPP